jgi:hypothetical protein
VSSLGNSGQGSQLRASASFGSTVEFRGKRVPTQLLSSTELTFTLDAESMKQANRFDLVVMNPAPTDTFFTRGMWGNGTSNLAHIIVNYRY